MGPSGCDQLYGSMYNQIWEKRFPRRTPPEVC